jgi:hypothetical protein
MGTPEMAGLVSEAHHTRAGKFRLAGTVLVGLKRPDLVFWSGV